MKNFKSLRRAIRRGKAMLVPVPTQMKMIVMRKTGRGGWQQVGSF